MIEKIKKEKIFLPSLFFKYFKDYILKVFSISFPDFKFEIDLKNKRAEIFKESFYIKEIKKKEELG